MKKQDQLTKLLYESVPVLIKVYTTEQSQVYEFARSLMKISQSDSALTAEFADLTAKSKELARKIRILEAYQQEQQEAAQTARTNKHKEFRKKYESYK